MVLESCGDLVFSSAMSASVKLPPHSGASSPAVVHFLRICPSLAAKSTPGLSACSSSSCSWVISSLRCSGTSSRRKNGTSAACESSPVNLRSLSRVRDKVEGHELWRKRPTRSSSSCGVIQRVLAAGEADLIEEHTDDANLLDLEAEIYEFMQKSGKPRHFPSKEDLITAGRMDLVESIVFHGGWLSYGWDFDDADEDEKNSEKSNGDKLNETNGFSNIHLSESNSISAEDYEISIDSCDERFDDADEDENNLEKFYGHDLKTNGFFNIPLSESNSISEEDYEISIEGKSINTEDESGIDGILKRLEKERLFSFTDTNRRMSSEDHDSNRYDGGIARERRNISPNHQNQGFAKFEGKFVNGVHQKEHDSSSGLSQNCVHSCLLLLESELSSILSSIQSRKDTVSPLEGKGRSLKEVHKLADAQEFVETEIMNVQDKLRFTKAQISVLEGKMALQLIEYQKVIDEKQRRIDVKQKALNFIRTAYVAWPNSASEVLLAGSFDGWASQRRMERSSTGIFFLNLRLYPGHYEIKFIVDGVWKVDPLRPIVQNQGFENNLLTVL